MRLVAFALSIVAAGIITAAAAADAPTKADISRTVAGTLTGACSFDVPVSIHHEGVKLIFRDDTGALKRVFEHLVEQDTFTANGITLTGLPYTFSVEYLFEGDVITHASFSGEVERVILPDGTLFLSAGRLDQVDHPGEDFLLSPDFGRSGDVTAFCAAFA